MLYCNTTREKSCSKKSRDYHIRHAPFLNDAFNFTRSAAGTGQLDDGTK